MSTWNDSLEGLLISKSWARLFLNVLQVMSLEFLKDLQGNLIQSGCISQMEIHQPFLPSIAYPCIWDSTLLHTDPWDREVLLRYRKVYILPPHKPPKPMHCNDNLHRFHPWVALDLCVSASLVLQQDHTSRWYNRQHVSQPVPPVQLQGSWASCMVGSCVLPKFQTWS